METSKIYFDTNVVLDIIGPYRPNHNKATLLWELAVVNNYQITISEDMLSTIFYINRDNRYTLNFFKVIYKRWTILPFGKEIIKKAIDLSLKDDLDLEDTLQCLCAKENECDLFVTSDKKFYDCGIKIVGYEYFEL